MTRRVVGGTAGVSSVVTQNNSAYVLLAETTNVASINAFSGMTNPVMIDGTTTVTFANIPQTYRDLKIQLSYMSHNTNNASQYRFTWFIKWFYWYCYR